MRLYSIHVEGLDLEAVSDRCWVAGAAGIWEAGPTSWRVGVDEGDVAGFTAALADLDPVDVTDTEAYEAPARAVDVDGLLLVVPPTVFGDGNHATTAACLAALEAAVAPGDTVLDVGCGSGVLSIAAARRGGVVTAIDIDPDAVWATDLNAAANSVAVDASTTTLAALRGRFDVVVANLTIGAMSPLLSDLERVTAPGGTLVVSGLLEDQWPAVHAALGSLRPTGFAAVTVDVRSGWVTATMAEA